MSGFSRTKPRTKPDGAFVFSRGSAGGRPHKTGAAGLGGFRDQDISRSDFRMESRGERGEDARGSRTRREPEFREFRDSRRDNGSANRSEGRGGASHARKASPYGQQGQLGRCRQTYGDKYDSSSKYDEKRRGAAGFKPAAQVSATGGDSDGLVRLSKRMSELGLASRREADEWIAAGWVLVDGRTAQVGEKVGPRARIEVRREARAAQQQLVTILLNKPVGYVSGQAEDGYEPARVLVRPGNHWEGDASRRRFAWTQLKSLVPAGRLDIDSVGLLVLTQDGRVAKAIIGESSTVDKEYIVRVANADGSMPPEITEARLQKLRHGLVLDGRELLEAGIEQMNESEIRFVLHEGRKRQIRRMCEAVGLKVVRLKRVRIGGVRLGALPLGMWRYLAPDEHF